MMKLGDLTEAQRRAILLIERGGVVFDAESGGAKRLGSNLKSARIDRRTVRRLVDAGVVGFDTVMQGYLKLTTTGKELRERIGP